MKASLDQIKHMESSDETEHFQREKVKQDLKAMEKTAHNTVPEALFAFINSESLLPARKELTLMQD